MNKPKEYMFAYLLDAHHPGDTFTVWPLHITLLPWFKLDVPLDEFKTELQRILNTTKSVSVKVGSERQFGRRSVNLIESSAGLLALHELLLDYAKNNGEFTVNKQLVGEQFNPHITKNFGKNLATGKLVNVNRVYLISAPPEDPRTRLKTVVIAPEFSHG
jgi:2'-5' RNA ligase